jgi:hypothetical protein
MTKGMMMRNRWGVEIKKGYYAWGAWGNQNSPVEGTIVAIDKTSNYAKAYGPGVTIRNARGDDLTISPDSISQVLPPMRVLKGGIVKANPVNRYSVAQFRKDLKEPYAWPGGYPRFFLTNDGEALSFKEAKANARQIMEAIRDHDRSSGWLVVGADVNWEDDDLYCAHSGDKIESAYGENPTPRLTRYDQKSQRERINPRTGKPTKAPSKRLKERRMITHHLAPEGVWANPLTRVKLKSPMQRPAGAGAVPEKGSRQYKRRQTTNKAPDGFYANPAEFRVYVARDNMPTKRRIGTFSSLAKAKKFAQQFADEHGTQVCVVTE